MVGLMTAFITQSYLLSDVIKAADRSCLPEFTADDATIFEVPSNQGDGFEQVFLRTIQRMQAAGPNVLAISQPSSRK